MQRTIALLTVFAALTLASSSSRADPPQANERRCVIIHADDAGMCHAVNAGTIEGLAQGGVSSASIMVPCPWFKEFAAYARENPDGDYGIHLTLNSEWDNYRWGPVAPRGAVSSLVDEEGYLWDNVDQVRMNAKAEEVEIELRAQIERAKEFGVPLSHLDTHMGAVFARADIARVYLKLGIEYNLPVLVVRPSPDNDVAQRYPDIVSMLGPLEERKLPVLDALFQFYERGTLEQRKQRYLDALRDLKPGVSEIIIHCGVDDAELRSVTSSVQIRDTDRRIFTDPDVLAEIERLGIEVITWKQFHAMSAGK